MKKPLIVSLSLLTMYTIGFLMYLGLNIGVNALIKQPLSFVWFILITHFFSMLWCIIIIINKKRRIETRIRWFIFISVIPFFGIISYLFFGRPYKYRKNQKYLYDSKSISIDHLNAEQNMANIKMLESTAPQFKRAFLSAFKQQKESLYSNFEIEPFKNGNEYYQDLLPNLKKAKKYILINMYIIHEGELLNQISNILISKISEGVKVYIVYDFLGCYSQFTKTKKTMKQAGIEMVAYAPLHFPFIKWNANYRNHRKDIVIDGEIGYVGGINIGDEYINKSNKFGYWDDSAYKIKGTAVKELEKIFKQDWNFYKKPKMQNLELPQNNSSIISKSSKDILQIISDGPNHANPINLDILLSLINSAQKKIWIKSPYFVPPPEIIDALCHASATGLDVRILLPGKTDKFMLLEVSKNWTKKLFDHNVKIYSMYDTFIHEKSYIFDNLISFVGTTNMDYRALFSDQQTMLLVKSESLNEKIYEKMLGDIEKSFEYKFVPNKDLSLRKRAFVKLYNSIAPLL